MTVTEHLERKLKLRVAERMCLRLGVPQLGLGHRAQFVREIADEQSRIAELLLQLTALEPPHEAPAWGQAPEGGTPEPAEEPAAPEETATVPGAKEEPTAEILARALKLQTLALRSSEPNEQNAAWAQFGKLWNKYRLPTDLGI
jgi:hypothetical protein